MLSQSKLPGGTARLKSAGVSRDGANSAVFSSVVNLVTPSISSRLGPPPQIYLPFRQSKNGRKMRAANRRKQPVTTFSPLKRKGEAKRREVDGRRFACLDVSALSLSLSFFP